MGNRILVCVKYGRGEHAIGHIEPHKYHRDYPLPSSENIAYNSLATPDRLRREPRTFAPLAAGTHRDFRKIRFWFWNAEKARRMEDPLRAPHPSNIRTTRYPEVYAVVEWRSGEITFEPRWVLSELLQVDEEDVHQMVYWAVFKQETAFERRERPDGDWFFGTEEIDMRNENQYSQERRRRVRNRFVADWQGQRPHRRRGRDPDEGIEGQALSNSDSD